MKISYVLQLKDLSIMLLFGFLLGIIYGLLNIPNTIKKKLFIQIISDIIFSLTSIFIYIVLINKVNMGESRLFLILGYVLGFTIERISLGKLFAKGYKRVYTSIVKLLNQFYRSKIGRFIFK